ncbi:hypothetical protein FLONG3_2511 [Fusarium longipes]|uniref:Uncharacterized protein n=1 Tax=Fusarium longipes TaxID=694270 RepID=A0A395T4G1_9HYPO|nr:hypothetical protein FLONG3_2511 [Fusarium longipes]
MESDSLSCYHCGETFQRREHRDRHLLRHGGHKPFQCNVCFKSFGRQDTLARHRALHDSRTEQNRSRRPRGQACVTCSRLKQGCSRGHPCSRCKKKGKECFYNVAHSSEITIGDNYQGGTTSSPLTARDTDSVNEDISSHGTHTMQNEWSDPSSILFGTTHIPNVYETFPDTTISEWQPNEALPNGNLGELYPMAGVSCIPWNSLTVSSSFPWFMEGLDTSLGFPHLPDLEDPIEVDTASSASTTVQVTESVPVVPVAATRGESSNYQIYLSPEHICSSYTRPCLSFPKLQDVSIQIAGTELFGHVHTISQHAITSLNGFYKTQKGDGVMEAVPREILHAFVELYFEYFDSQFPFLHPSTMEDPDLPWILLLATAAIGSHYSEIQGAEEYNIALCDLLARAVEQTANKRRQPSQAGPDIDEAWRLWLARESEIRLSMCVRVLECLGHMFLFMPLDVNLREATRQLPCDERLWKCRMSLEWSKNRDRRSSTGAPFSFKVALLEFYLDDRDMSRQLLSSKRLRSSFTPLLGQEASTDAQDALNRLDIRTNNHHLIAIIDQLTLTNARTSGDTLVHFIAILTLLPIPLETLHFATGWRADQEQMSKAKRRLREFFQNDGSKARKGLWHAARIFKITRNSRRLMCYDALSLATAMGYIYSYSEARSSISQSAQPSHLLTRPSIVRLDQLEETSDVEQWIKSDTENIVHLTGVGLLDGSDDCIRLLLDIEKTLNAQIAWRGFCRMLATCFSQVRKGELHVSK